MEQLGSDPFLSPIPSVPGVHQNDQPRRGARHQEADVGRCEGRLRGHRSVLPAGQAAPLAVTAKAVWQQIPAAIGPWRLPVGHVGWDT